MKGDASIFETEPDYGYLDADKLKSIKNRTGNARKRERVFDVQKKTSI